MLFSLRLLEQQVLYRFDVIYIWFLSRKISSIHVSPVKGNYIIESIKQSGVRSTKSYFRYNFQRSCSSNSLILNKMDIAPTSKVHLGSMRVPYETEAAKDFSVKDPLKLFDIWFNDARNNASIREANAMAVATADRSGKPSVRYVLLKSYSSEGFVFYTNYNSRKGQEIAENPNAALLFYWESLCRQIRIEGSVLKVSDKESEEYFHSRPKSSQMSAVVSQQSNVIENKGVLVKRREEMEQKYSGELDVIPKPSHWGGYLVVPKSFEFWCGRSDRLHDRIRFRKALPTDCVDEKMLYSGENGWVYEYLSP